MRYDRAENTLICRDEVLHGWWVRARMSCRDGLASRSWPLQEPQIERREYQDDPDVCHQPRPEVVPEEQDVHADHDSYHREHVKHDGCLSSHCFLLLCAPQRSKSDAGFSETLAQAESSDAPRGAPHLRVAHRNWRVRLQLPPDRPGASGQAEEPVAFHMP